MAIGSQRHLPPAEDSVSRQASSRARDDVQRLSLCGHVSTSRQRFACSNFLLIFQAVIFRRIACPRV